MHGSPAAPRQAGGSSKDHDAGFQPAPTPGDAGCGAPWYHRPQAGIVSHAGARLMEGGWGERNGQPKARSLPRRLLIWSPSSSEVSEWLSFEIDRVMRQERCSDDESDSYPRIGYLHFIDSSRACLALVPWIFLAEPV